MADRPAPSRPRPIDGRVRAVMLGLSFAGGSVDAGTYLGLGHAFPANMTGNTVLLAIAVARGAGAELARSVAALGGFCLGVAAGTLALRGVEYWPQTAATTLALETAVLALVLGCWLAFGPGAHFGLIGAASVAMGAQSAAVRASHVGGVSTTYVTGTLTTAVARLVGRLRHAPAGPPGSPALPGESWLVYGLGALAGAAAERAFTADEMAIAVAVVGVCAVAARRMRTKER